MFHRHHLRKINGNIDGNGSPIKPLGNRRDLIQAESMKAEVIHPLELTLCRVQTKAMPSESNEWRQQYFAFICYPR